MSYHSRNTHNKWLSIKITQNTTTVSKGNFSYLNNDIAMTPKSKRQHAVFSSHALESLISGRSGGHGRQEGCARSGSSTAFVPRKAKIKQWIVFGITRVTDFMSVFISVIWNVFIHSNLNFRKIFVAEGDSYILFAPFSYMYEQLIFHIYSPSLKCRRVLHYVDPNQASKN